MVSEGLTGSGDSVEEGGSVTIEEGGTSACRQCSCFSLYGGKDFESMTL